jgi:hypothetical protein
LLRKLNNAAFIVLYKFNLGFAHFFIEKTKSDICSPIRTIYIVTKNTKFGFFKLSTMQTTPIHIP